MIVCQCNVFTDHDVRRVCTPGPDCARRVAEVYSCLGCSPQCGRCARTVLQVLRTVDPQSGSETCEMSLDVRAA